MLYVASLVIAVGLLLVAGALVALQVRLREGQRVAIVVVTFLGGVATNVALSGSEGGSFSVSLQQTLDWTYSALTMFAGAGSVDVIRDLATPSGLPVTGVQLVSYFFQVFAFLFTVSAVVAVLAKDTMDRFWVAVRGYAEVFEIHGTSAEAVALARTLAAETPPAGRRLVSLVATFSDEERAALVNDRIVVAAGSRPIRAKFAGATTASVVLVDSGEPDFQDLVRTVVSELSTVDHDRVRLFVVVASSGTRDMLEATRTPFEIRAVERAELVARDLIHTRAPHQELSFENGRPTTAFSALVISDELALQERIVEHVVMNAQFLGASPLITLLSPAPGEGTFRMRHPEVDLACRLEFSTVDPDSKEFYALLDERRFDQVVIARASQTESLTIARDVAIYFRRHRSVDHFPRLLVRADARESMQDDLTFFGGNEAVFSSAALVHEVQDRDARRVNAFYSRLDPDDAKFDDKARELWRNLTYVNRASSRASADFAGAMRAVSHSLVDHSDTERGEVLAQTEHLRWNAFYRMLGYQRMSVEEMGHRYAEAIADSSRTPNEGGRHARDDDRGRRHICLVDWDELPALDIAYNGLDERLTPRDFQESDRDVIRHQLA